MNLTGFLFIYYLYLFTPVYQEMSYGLLCLLPRQKKKKAKRTKVNTSKTKP